MPISGGAGTAPPSNHKKFAGGLSPLHRRMMRQVA